MMIDAKIIADKLASEWGVGHKMGHYIGYAFLTSSNTWNNTTYSLMLKFYHKLADVMIKPKIRDDKGYWNQIEAYIQDHSEAEFSHGICQECADKYYPEMVLYGDDDG